MSGSYFAHRWCMHSFLLCWSTNSIPDSSPNMKLCKDPGSAIISTTQYWKGNQSKNKPTRFFNSYWASWLPLLTCTHNAGIGSQAKEWISYNLCILSWYICCFRYYTLSLAEMVMEMWWSYLKVLYWKSHHIVINFENDFFWESAVLFSNNVALQLTKVRMFPKVVSGFFISNIIVEFVLNVFMSLRG